MSNYIFILLACKFNHDTIMSILSCVTLLHSKNIFTLKNSKMKFLLPHNVYSYFILFYLSCIINFNNRIKMGFFLSKVATFFFLFSKDIFNFFKYYKSIHLLLIMYWIFQKELPTPIE